MTFEEKLNSLYKQTVPLITYNELEEKLVENKEIILLDVRSPKEYQVSRIAGARLISYDDFHESMLDGITKDAEIVVYCSVGYRSERVGEKMLKMEFTNVSNLYGGIFEWKNQGQSVINEQGERTDSVHTYNKKWSQWLTNGIKIYE